MFEGLGIFDSDMNENGKSKLALCIDQARLKNGKNNGSGGGGR
ncbi:MAG TPA: hypothetical protein VMU71_01110 [Terracidiphilus sp.]|nr:hypothetical protein [Terracidiphilus sp.]